MLETDGPAPGGPSARRGRQTDGGKASIDATQPATLAIAAALRRPVEYLGAGHEDRHRAGEEEQIAPRARVGFKIMKAPGRRAEGERIDDRIGLPARLDGEKASDACKHIEITARSGPRAESVGFPQSAFKDL